MSETVSAHGQTIALPRAAALAIAIDAYLVVPLIGPALLLLAGNADFMFDPPGWVDTFYLLGYFWHYPEHLAHLAYHYKSSRLPWIVPGYLAHHVFTEVAASYVLHTTVLVGSSIALYVLLRDTVKDRLAAAVTAAAWSCCTWVHGIGGWNYHVVAAGGYYLVGLWLLVRTAASRHARALPVLAGVSLAASIHTHTLFVAFAPAVALLYMTGLEGGLRTNARRICGDALHVIGGAFLVTAVLGAINGLTGGAWLFFMPQVEYTWSLGREGNRWVQEPLTWVPVARHLVIPMLSLAAGLVWVAARAWRLTRLTPGERFAVSFVIQGWLAFGVMAYFQFAKRQTVLDWSYAAFPLYCHVFPVIGAVLSQTAKTVRRHDLAFALGCAVVIVAALAVLLPDRIFEQLTPLLHQIGLSQSPPVLTPLASGAAALILMAVLPARARILAFAVVFAVLNAWLAPAPSAYGIGTPGIRRDMVVVIRHLDRFTTSVDPSLVGIKYWFERETVQGPRGAFDLADVFTSYVSTRSRTANRAALDRPDLTAEQLSPWLLRPGRCLGLLSSSTKHDELLARVKRRFSDIDSPLIEVGRGQLTRGALSVAITILALPVERGARPGYLCTATS